MTPSTQQDLHRTERATGRTTTERPAVAVTETVTITAITTPSSGYLLTPMDRWDWHDLRDYVVTQIETRRGPQPRDPRKEFGIFSRFLATYEELAPMVARYAFEVCDGMWAGAPISVTRFCRGSDTYFALPILERIADTDWYPATA